MAYWILKTDADVYPFDQLEREREAVWDGVSNALALQTHPQHGPGRSCAHLPLHVGKELVGLARVTSAPYPDPKQQGSQAGSGGSRGGAPASQTGHPGQQSKRTPVFRRSWPGTDVSALGHPGAGAAVEEAAGDGRRPGR